MADLTVTPANVLPGADSDYYQGIAGEAITAGQPCYLDSLTHRLYKTDANASADAAEVKGIALNGADEGQALRLATEGTITIGATTVESTVYIVSGTAGGIAPVADLASGWYCSIIGVGGPTNTIKLGLFPSQSKKA